MFDAHQIEAYRRNGHALARGLFSTQEASALCDHYMALRAAGSYPGDSAGVDPKEGDPLKQYPRMIHMHRWDEVSLHWLLDPRLRAHLRALLGCDAYAVQTMLYFKPAGARGQALHQDQYYLKTKPGTCMAAWMALDPCDEENGCMQLVPGSHDLPVLCTEEADIQQSFTGVTVPLPEKIAAVPVVMDPGDVLFFNGSAIHGSHPNRSRDRFRRALIGHYISGEAEQVARFYHPVLRMDGSVVALQEGEDGGPCGVWVEMDGTPVVKVGGRGK